MIFFGAGVKVVWVVRDVAGRQTMMNLNLAPHKILDNFYISSIYLVYV